VARARNRVPRGVDVPGLIARLAPAGNRS
jgi:hypothetical protein